MDDLTDNAMVFSLFLQFAYFGSYSYDQAAKEDAFLVHAGIYVFAEKIEALDLKNLALKMATKLCSDASGTRPEFLKVLQFALPETVPVIYEGTYDTKTGKLPSAVSHRTTEGTGEIKVPTFTRDGFRLLLASFSACYIDVLRKNESFVSVLEAYPAFAADILLFVGKGQAILTDTEGNLKI
ncbi:hypothetical protein ABW20_dc0100495 [Dactylellina cionopaga]|nr:hypothetical protein ABW20_dc0100495 [Dactylellina cionopaga]